MVRALPGFTGCGDKLTALKQSESNKGTERESQICCLAALYRWYMNFRVCERGNLPGLTRSEMGRWGARRTGTLALPTYTGVIYCIVLILIKRGYPNLFSSSKVMQRKTENLFFHGILITVTAICGEGIKTVLVASGSIHTWAGLCWLRIASSPQHKAFYFSHLNQTTIFPFLLCPQIHENSFFFFLNASLDWKQCHTGVSPGSWKMSMEKKGQ